MKAQPKTSVLMRTANFCFEKFLAIDLLGPREKCYQLQNNCQTNLVDPRKMFPGLCYVR